MTLERITLLAMLALGILLTSCVPDSQIDDIFLELQKDPFTSSKLTLRDADSSSSSHTNGTLIDVEITNDQVSLMWCLSEEQTTAPETICNGGEGADNGWFSSRPTTFNLSAGDGTKNLYLWLVKPSGDVRKTAIKSTIVLDTVSPIVTLNPASDINISNANPYTLSGSCSDSTKIKIDLGGLTYYANCSEGTWAYSGDVRASSDGNITINVTQTDNAGNVSNTATDTISKDSTSPIIVVTSPLSTSFINNTNKASFPFSGTCTEDGVINISGSITDTITCSSGTFSKNIDLSALGDLTLTFNFDLNDAVGNPAARQTINVVKDVVLPTVAISTPAAASYINNAWKDSFTITGTCSEEGRAVNISGAATASATCTSGTFSKNFNLTAVADGAVTFYVDMTDAAGNSAVQGSRSYVKDTVAPTIVQNSYTDNAFSNLNTVTFGGTCENGSTISVSGTDTSTATCDSGAWTYTTSSQSSDGSYSYTFTHADAAGNSSSISSSWQRDATAPTVNSVVIADGAANVGSSFVIVKATASDNQSVTHLRLANSHAATDDCQSEYADDNWQVYNGGTQSYSHQILPGDGQKKVCVWAKDHVGNVNVFAPTAGTLGVNMDTVAYEVGNPPVVTSFNVVNNTAGANFGTSNYAAGDQVKIDWTVTDAEELSDSPINLYYATSSSSTANWIEIVTNYGSIGGGQTTYTGSYLTFTAPSSSYFRLKIVAKDSAGNTSVVAESGPMNTGNWSVYAGSSDRGVGGSANAVTLYTAGGGLNTAGLVTAINPLTNDAYVIDCYYGIYKLDAITGKVDYFIRHGETNLTDGATIDSSTRIDTSYVKMAFDSNGLLYLMVNKINGGGAYDNDGTIVWQLDLETNIIKKYLGGGTVADNSATPLTAHAAVSSFTFDESNSLYYFALCDPTRDFSSLSTSDTAIRLMKVTQNSSTKTAGAVSIVAGNCVRAIPTSGGNAMTEPSAGGGFYTSISNIAAWDNGDKIVYCLYNQCYKIKSGTIYRTSLSSFGIFYHPVKKKVYYSSNGLYEVAVDFTQAYNDVLSLYVSYDGTGPNCLDDGADRLSSCSKVFYSASVGPSGTVAFLQGASNNSKSNYSLRYVDSNDKLQTYVGTKPFYGDGLDKAFLRSSVAGIHYKKASDPNQASFPEGLYFVDRAATTFNYIGSDNVVSIIAGNQTTSSSGMFAEGDPMSTSKSLGVPYWGGVMTSLGFNDQGLPSMRVGSSLLQFQADKTAHYLMGGSIYYDEAQDGDDPLNYRLYVYGGQTNLTYKGDSKLFLMGAYISATSRPTVLSGTITLFDFGGGSTYHLMGDSSQAAASSADDSTGGNLSDKTLHGYCDSAPSCYKLYRPEDDRLYFSESNKLRYITTPDVKATSTLGTLFTASEQIKNFIFSEDGTQIFYVNSSGKLVCFDNGSGKAWCNGTALGPTEGMSSIISGPNQLTWKDATTLLISNYGGLIYQYNLLP